MLPCLATQSLRCLGVLLDEPANDLDMTSVRQLSGALADIDPLQGSLALPAKALRRPARSWVR